MGKDAISIIIQPYKNLLIPEDKLRGCLYNFSEKLIKLLTEFSFLKLNLVLPSYLFKYIDEISLSHINECQKSGRLEWITTGFTEPFITFSPNWLTYLNIKKGIEATTDAVDAPPVGFMPAFSNWEPGIIETLNRCGLQYAVISNALLPREAKNSCGFWVTEHQGSTIALFPAHIMHYYNAPSNPFEWIRRTVKGKSSPSNVNLLTINYLVPLNPEPFTDPYKWLFSFSKRMEKHPDNYQSYKISEYQSFFPSLGLQYISPSLALKRGDGEIIHDFSNFLHSFSQIGIIQRKMMAVSENLNRKPDFKEKKNLIEELFYTQDINRYLPGDKSGFSNRFDREWVFGKLISIEKKLQKIDKNRGGQIKISDFLKNASKSIMLSNRFLKAYIDYKTGGTIFELDYILRKINLFSAFNQKKSSTPRIISTDNSTASFSDYFLSIDCLHGDYISGTAKEYGNFRGTEYDYSIKKTPSAVKVILNRQGNIIMGEKSYPLVLEKVFGLAENGTNLSFAYQLSNPSLLSYSFKFAFTCSLSLPGAQNNEAEIEIKGEKHKNLSWNRIYLSDITNWLIKDNAAGISIRFTLQKPAELWCFPIRANETSASKYNGTVFVISSDIKMSGNDVWSLIGNMEIKNARKKRKKGNAV